MVGLMSHSLELKGTVPRSTAEKAPEQPGVRAPRSPLPPGEAPETTATSSVKRKVTTSGNLSPELEIILKTPGGGKRPKRSTDEGTLRGNLARKVLGRLKRTTEGGTPFQSSAPQEKKVGAVSSDRSTKESKAPPLVLPKTVRHIELKKRKRQE